MVKKILLISLFWLNICNVVTAQLTLTKDDVTVLEAPFDTMMRDYLYNIIDKQFAERDSLLSRLITCNDWENRAMIIRDSIRAWTGTLPEKTPLKAKTTGRLERDGYSIEKILFESRPNYFVTANLYLPKNYRVPRPALLNVIGHTPLGKADERYQRISVNMAKKGFVVLTIDCLGQGERIVSDYSSWSSAPGNAHQIIGIQSFLSGTHVFNFMVWDAIRAIDYLVSRKEVDPENICITGSSGGGMMSTYILAFDDRIKVTVPTCNPNIWNYRVHANLGSDHEQVFFGAFESKIDPRSDPLFIHVPKPMLLNTTTDDHLNPVRGVWDLTTSLYKAYSACNQPDHFTTTMVKAGHAYNREQREITYSWMLHWTGGSSSSGLEEDFILEKEQDLWAAPGGSVFNLPESRNTHELVVDWLEDHQAEWQLFQNKKKFIEFKSKIPLLVKNSLKIQTDSVNAYGRFVVTEQKGDIDIRHFKLEPEKGIVIPGIILESARGGEENIILYLHEKGKSEILNAPDIIETLIRKGFKICAVDLRGIGETSPDMMDRYFWDFLSGKPIFGQRVEDILSTINWLKKSEGKNKKIHLLASGMCAVYGSFAGTLTNDINSFYLINPLISFQSVVQTKVPEYHNEILLNGILQEFDMPQIYQTLSPNPVMVLNPYLGNKKLAGSEEIKKIGQIVQSAFEVTNSSESWSMIKQTSQEEKEKLIIDFFLKNK